MNSLPEERDLFDPPYPDTPGFQKTDTSFAAAQDMRSVAQVIQGKAYAAICRAGTRGLTTEELSVCLDINYRSVQPRTSELRCKGVIKDSGRRRPNVSRKMAIVWITDDSSANANPGNSLDRASAQA